MAQLPTQPLETDWESDTQEIRLKFDEDWNHVSQGVNSSLKNLKKIHEDWKRNSQAMKSSVEFLEKLLSPHEEDDDLLISNFIQQNDQINQISPLLQTAIPHVFEVATKLSNTVDNPSDKPAEGVSDCFEVIMKALVCMTEVSRIIGLKTDLDINPLVLRLIIKERKSTNHDLRSAEDENKEIHAQKE
ncbi:hypothetical protein M441DRAFT_453332 [Trichoderma asperellum CBS 433.97]|uniref:Uncharacterized protein n=1 Tax=Trichoderma asperellum (strain ATCC 204424 / CBS 433.97 / NBRC 101777) TaxID=1042311 RepID=A0A2T3ZGC2_TRIA4|nr:hypothetical protein M441DRAFT_453332 [Trichoderma asperellum CBS 433.97]PTB43839.1 hypothetical protein M441DRAFT_453332 [Trichoderma asperellum CBS 433.97]